MTDHHRPDEVDRLLAGGEPDDALGRFLADARSALTEGPDEVTAARHLAEVVEVARQYAHTTPRGQRVVAGAAPWRRRVAHVLGLTASKVAAGVGIAAAATGGLAATDSLPDPAQRVVSEAVAHIGIDLPHPDDPQTPDDAVTPVETPVQQLPSPETGRPDEVPADRADSTRGAEVDPPGHERTEDRRPDDVPSAEPERGNTDVDETHERDTADDAAHDGRPASPPGTRPEPETDASQTDRPTETGSESRPGADDDTDSGSDGAPGTGTAPAERPTESDDPEVDESPAPTPTTGASTTLPAPPDQTRTASDHRVTD